MNSFSLSSAFIEIGPELSSHLKMVRIDYIDNIMTLLSVFLAIMQVSVEK